MIIIFGLNVAKRKAIYPFLKSGLSRRSRGGDDGFTILEILIAMVVSSIALLALASLSLTVVGGNKVSKHSFEAAALAQDTLEALRYSGFSKGPDGIFGNSDDIVPTALLNSNTGNDSTLIASQLFASPDHAFQLDASGNETSTILNSPSLTPGTRMRRAWVIKDNVPTTDMKTIIVIVGWKEGSTSFYTSVNTALQGK